MSRTFSKIDCANRANRLPFGAALLGQMACIGVLTVTTTMPARAGQSYAVELTAQIRPSAGAFGSVVPFTTFGQNASLIVRFTIDDSTGMQFGDPACGGGVPATNPCTGIGYLVEDLSLTVNGKAVPEWVAGTNPRAFVYTPFDTAGARFFLPRGIPGLGPAGVGEVTNGWLPLINPTAPGSTLSFGLMYLATAGMAFTPFWAAASDGQGGWASGGISGQISPLTAVPEPSTSALFLAALVGLAWRARAPLAARRAGPRSAA